MQSGQGAHILTGRFQNLNHTPILYIVDIDMHGVHINPTDNMTIDVVYSHIFIDDAETNLTERGLLKGDFELDADIIGAQLSYRF